ncbi:MAG: hypothetical protein A4S09_15430 [Proteobacteria bacterium SG_bin7]|nr:MAG: hypothetical protein A4S09_15430 [Proteobacteria bacterium SG_bin7]
MDFHSKIIRGLLLVVIAFHVSCTSTDESAEESTLSEGETEQVVDGSEDADEETAASDEGAGGDALDLDAELAKDEKEEQSVPTTSKAEDIDKILGDEGSSKDVFETAVGPRASIKDIKYLSQINGGAIGIELSKEATYRLRKGKDEKQNVLEIPNTVLPDRFKRPYITKEFDGPFVSFEAYQAASSSTTRVLIQQRVGGEPAIRMSGKVIYISSPDRPIQDEQMAVVSKAQAIEESALALPMETRDLEMPVDEGNVLKSKSLYEYLTSNNRFYGKKISLEVRGADVRDVLNFLAENSGLNMIVDDQVTGKVTMKLNKIPWDHALLLVLQSRRLGYLRQGNVLRIAPLASLREEAEEASTILESRKKLEDLIVKIVLVSYGSAKDLAPQLKPFLTSRGSAVADPRTSAIILTDVASNLDKVEKLIKSLDTPPPQVLIEGKIVEASDNFTREIGLNWGFSGVASSIGSNNQGGITTLTPNLNVRPTGPATPAMTAGLLVGQADFFGDVSATLTMYELDQKIKILSSPRVATLHNVQSEITQNQQVPYAQPPQTGTVPGGIPAPAVYAFKDVKLSLKVTPQVTSDESVILDLEINRDVLGAVESGQPPIVNTRQAKTKVLVKNGQTAVIGGIYQNDSTQSASGVPLLKDLPVLGWLFKATKDISQRNELLIFLTPRILAGPITSTIN